MGGKISMAVIRRLPKYHRYLNDLMNKGVTRISSQELSSLIGFTASQIRQDFNNFGGFGQQGYGYNVEDLYNEIGNIIGLVKDYNIVIVGAGNLGQALANYNFGVFGFKIGAIFDIDPSLIGRRIGGAMVKDVREMETYFEESPVDIGFICTNKGAAQNIAERLCKAGVKAIWNFAPVDIKIRDDVVIENVFLVDSLMTLTYFIQDK